MNAVPEAANASRRLPVWAMGLANAPTGFVFGFISTAFGILLSARHVPVDRIGTISVYAFSPTWSAWLLCPVLDVRFTKRAYAFLFAGLAAVAMGVTVLSLDHLATFTVALTVSCAAAVFYSNAVASEAAETLGDAEYDRMGGWFNVANLGAAGVFSALVVVCVRLLPLGAAASVLALLVFLPALLLLRFAPGRRPEGRLRANFTAMARDLRRVFRQGRIWVGLLLFLLPESCFALTNLFSSLGADFHTGERAVTVLNGPGVAVVCSVGCLLGIPLCRLWRRRTVYLVSGLLGAAFAILAALTPHTPALYALALLGYNGAQGFNYTAFTALILEIVGPQNALSGTMVALLMASGNLPITMMTKLEGHVHDAHSLGAMLFTDALSSIATTAVLLAVVLPLLDRYVRTRQAPAVL